MRWVLSWVDVKVRYDVMDLGLVRRLYELHGYALAIIDLRYMHMIL